MKKGKTIIFTIISVCLVCALSAFCVYSLLDSKSMSINNSFSFSPQNPATEMIFSMDCICSGARETDKEVPGQSQEEYRRANNYIYSPSYDNTKADQGTVISAWDIGNLTFKTENDAIYYRFEITNKSFNKGLRVTISQTSDENVYFENEIYTYNSKESTSGNKGVFVEIPKAIDEDGAKTYQTKVIEVKTSCLQAVAFTRDNNFSLSFEAID